MSEQKFYVTDTTACPGCGCVKPRTHYICADCRETYGGKAADWPEWLRMLVNDSARWRAEDRQAAEREIPLDDFEPFEDMDGDLDEALMTRPREEMFVMRAPTIALPYAPYDNDADNRDYRRANGIPERG